MSYLHLLSWGSLPLISLDLLAQSSIVLGLGSIVTFDCISFFSGNPEKGFDDNDDIPNRFLETHLHTFLNSRPHLSYFHALSPYPLPPSYFLTHCNSCHDITYPQTCSFAHERIGTPTKSRNQGNNDSHILSKKLRTATLIELSISNSSFPPVIM